MPSAVSGLTNEDAPSTADVPGGKTRHDDPLATRNCAYIDPPATATVRPRSACASGEGPAATTVPAPSLPAGSDLPTRPERTRSAPSGSGAVTTGRSDVPSTDAVSKSAPASNRPKSDGLIGAASTRTRISPELRGGRGTSANESSSVPCSVTSERSSSELIGSGSVTVGPHLPIHPRQLITVNREVRRGVESPEASVVTPLTIISLA